MAFDAFLKLDGIPGESSDDKHTDWIDVLAFEHGADQPNAGSVGSRGVERVNQRAFMFTHEVDKSSPKLQVAMHNGSNIATGEMEVCKATGDKTVYYKISLEDIVVGSMSTTGSKGGDTPGEVVTLWPAKITWTYTETDHKTGASQGNVEGHWSYEENSGG